MRMHLKLILAAGLVAAPSLAIAQSGGAAAGAAAGGAAGAIVGGPVGAAVGAGVGGAAGAAGSDRNNVTIEHRNVESTGTVGCSTQTKQTSDSATGTTTTQQRTNC
jgi:uncharacterized protein YcfJ